MPPATPRYVEIARASPDARSAAVKAAELADLVVRSATLPLGRREGGACDGRFDALCAY
jgi:hypothetical protein